MSWRQLSVRGGGINAIMGAGGAPVIDGVEVWDDDLVDVAACRVDHGPAAAPWAATGNLLAARGDASNNTFPALAVLADGRVLVAGGADGLAAATATCEIYDPRAGTWAAAGALNAARGAAFAALLNDGRVLVAGGFNVAGGPAVNTCEVYDPAADAWAPTGNLGTARAYAPLILLPSGRVLVVGGISAPAGVPLASCELYDPTAGTWAPTDALSVERIGGGVVMLANGLVLAAGGIDAAFTVLGSCELYDPAGGTWAPTGPMIDPRVSLNGIMPVVALAAGGALAVSGGTTGFVPTPACETYDQVLGSWTATDPLPAARLGATLLRLPSGDVLELGGQDAGGVPSATCAVYGAGAGTWAATGPLAAARTTWGALLPDGRALVVGGMDAVPAALASCEAFSCAVPALTTAAGVSAVTALAPGFYRLTLTAAARAQLAAGRHFVAEPASLAQPAGRAAQTQAAQVVGTDAVNGTVDVMTATNPVGVGPCPLPFTLWIR